MGRVTQFTQTWVAPLLGEQGSVRRSNRVLPEPRQSVGQAATLSMEDEVVTTARTTTTTGGTVSEDQPLGESGVPTPSGDAAQPAGGLVRQWVTELAGAARPAAGGAGTVRVPSDAEIQVLTGMFPDIGRNEILGVLQRR